MSVFGSNTLFIVSYRIGKLLESTWITHHIKLLLTFSLKKSHQLFLISVNRKNQSIFIRRNRHRISQSFIVNFKIMISFIHSNQYKLDNKRLRTNILCAFQFSAKINIPVIIIFLSLPNIIASAIATHKNRYKFSYVCLSKRLVIVLNLIWLWYICALVGLLTKKKHILKNKWLRQATGQRR